MTRVVAVLGFSDGTTTALHPVCAARLARAAQDARSDDVVLFSGWARGRAPTTEADLMARAWSAPVRARIVDRRARTTLGNALGVARLARRIGADEILLVTSGWHGRRASALLRAALGRSGTTIQLVTCAEDATPQRRLRELASWTLVPLLALAARTR
jgi:uncharacterized SAM-binding protein YcdF (DUF218 family)